jgi:PAS domain-containing protein
LTPRRYPERIPQGKGDFAIDTANSLKSRSVRPMTDTMDLLRLPRGRTLSRAAWASRHRAITTVAWLHVPALLAFALLTGHSLGQSLLAVMPIASFAGAAGIGGIGRRARASMSTLALLTSSAVLVHLWDGHIEAHFHFFVTVSLLAIYEEWFTYLLAFAYVLVHHGVMGGLTPTSVFDHPDAVAHPWRWAGYHAAFISALGIINIISWRMQEDARAQSRASEERFRSAFDDAPIGMAIVGLDGTIERVNGRLASISRHTARTCSACR